MRNLIRFIQHYVMYLQEYDGYMWFKNNILPEEILKQYEEVEKEKGIKPHDQNRFSYAWNNAMIFWKHRDKYSHKCTGKCEECSCKHC